MIRSVLVPLDGSSLSEHALPLAAAVARRAGARLVLARVHELLPPAYGVGVRFAEKVDGALKEKERAELDAVRRRLPLDLTGQVTAELLEGDVVPALAARAAAADLVVMATHGYGPLARFWLGSVADQMVRVLPVPLLLVRPERLPADLDREPSLREIVVPLDGTAAAEGILGPAADVAALAGASLLLVRVVRPLLLEGVAAGTEDAGAEARSLLDDLRDEQRAGEAEARSYLESAAARLAGRGLKVQTRVQVAEQPSVAIFRAAEAAGADLIALTTRGRHGLPRLLLGSVADKIIRGSALPVLLTQQD
jgi:nucleotide-binding universal stress UspA family protein